MATSLNNLAHLMLAQGKRQEAEPLYRQALEMSRKLRGDEHPETATMLRNLAWLLVG